MCADPVALTQGHSSAPVRAGLDKWLIFKCQAITNLVSLGHEKLEVPNKILPASPISSGHGNEDGCMLSPVVAAVLESEVIEVLEANRRQL